MLKNSDIKTQLKIELENAISEFKSSDIDVKLQIGYDKLMSFDFESYKVKLKEEIHRKLSSVWTNVENGINPEQKLDAILLEHYIPNQLNLEAYAYGIIEWEERDVNDVDVDMGCSYDFADGLEQDEGITLDFFNPYVEIINDESIDDYKLAHCYRLKGFIAIHEVFYELYKQNTFNKINMNDEFYILVGEHDSYCYAVLSNLEN
ncbi:hypothetical protein [uncultured Psychroserpens sp.]|uniref:hypothetical protein n=1 Tax=uncultured Psychroserpens sp. TaxID=255436 RepID=UPI00260ACA6C|nr:hypothetical protein [uncultured Psychroserpens sp.]